MRKVLLAILLLGTLMIGAGCGSSVTQNSQNSPTGQVRIMQGSPDIGNVDALIDGQVAVSNLGFRGVFPIPTTNYLAAKVGARHFQEFPAGTRSPALSDLTLSLSSNNYYTVLTVGEQSSATLSTLILTDDHSAPAASQLKFRLVHGASAIGSVDVYITSQPTDPVPNTPAISNFAFKSVTSYLSVPGPSFQLCMNPVGVAPANMNACLFAVQFLPATAPQHGFTLMVLDPVIPSGGGTGGFTAPVIFASLPY